MDGHAILIKYVLYRIQKVFSCLNITGANIWPKDQIHKGSKAVYLFDPDLRPGESAYEWWVSLDQDRSIMHNLLRYVIY